MTAGNGLRPSSSELFPVGAVAPTPLAPLTEREIISRWRANRPLVSIICITYNHAAYIAHALDGFLGQITDFPIEVIVRDDASTDGTASIIEKYASRYPRIVRPILEPVNTFGRVNPLSAALGSAEGSFVAGCEGDDYWIDENKLQRQVEILKARADVAAVFHPSVPTRHGHIIGPPVHFHEDWVPPARMRRCPQVSLRELCFRPVTGDWIDWQNRIGPGARFLAARLGCEGAGVYLRDLVGSVYRYHETGLWSSASSVAQQQQALTTFYWSADYFAEKGDLQTARWLLGQAALGLATVQLRRNVDPRPRLALRLLLGVPRTMLRRVLKLLRLR